MTGHSWICYTSWWKCLNVEICFDDIISNVIWLINTANSKWQLGWVKLLVKQKVFVRYFWHPQSSLSNIIVSDSLAEPGLAVMVLRDSLDGLGTATGFVVSLAMICSWDSHMTFAGSTSEMEPKWPQKNESLVPLIFPCLTPFTVSYIPLHSCASSAWLIHLLPGLQNTSHSFYSHPLLFFVSSSATPSAREKWCM